MDGKKQFWKGIAVGFALTLVLVEGAILGRDLLEKIQNQMAETPQAELTSQEIENQLEDIETLINKYYLEEIDPEQVEEYLYKGAVAGLGDIYTCYYTKEEYQSFMESTEGSYCGIGVLISQNTSTGIITITKVFEGTPAMEAGILPGDILYKVGGREVTGLDLNTVVTYIKGKEYTKAEVEIVRENEEDYLTFQVERRVIEVPSVEHEMLENQVGYIAISSFDEVTYGQFEKALTELEEQGMEALVVDLRNNSGGLVSSVCAILDRLLPEGLLVYTEDKYGVREEDYSDAEHFFDKPLAVLVNENSASASEIFAGAIKDYEAGTIVGTTTFGKGIVQKIFSLDGGAGIKITVSKYYTPNGHNIHGIGIEPDVEVELDEALKNELVIPKNEDNQLQKALEVLGK